MVVIGKLINIQSDICQAEYVAGYPEGKVRFMSSIPASQSAYPSMFIPPPSGY